MQRSEVVLKILMLKKISVKCVCALFLVLVLEFLLMTTKTRKTFSVRSGAAILRWSSGCGGQENAKSCSAHSMMLELCQ